MIESDHLHVVNVTRATQQPSQLYEPIYVCAHPLSLQSDSIKCVRSTKSSNQTCGGTRDCHTHPINFARFGSCDLKCINLVITNSPYVRYHALDLPHPIAGGDACTAPARDKAGPIVYVFGFVLLVVAVLILRLLWRKFKGWRPLEKQQLLPKRPVKRSFVETW